MEEFEYIIVTEDGNTLIGFQDNILNAIRKASEYAIENEKDTMVFRLEKVSSFDIDGGSYDEGEVSVVEIIAALNQ